MKKHLLVATLVLCSLAGYGQGRSISREKKNSGPYIRQQGDTLRVGDAIQLAEGTGVNGQFLYVQLVNGFNEPIKPADSRAAGQRQTILFFKEQDGVTYLFTKFFVCNIEAAFNKGEVKRAVR